MSFVDWATVAPEVSEPWRKVWRAGFAPLIGSATLEALLEMIEGDDPRLVQGATTQPPPLMCVADWPIEGGCFLSACGAVENGGFVERGDVAHPDRNRDKARLGQCEEVFARLCFDADEKLGEPAACRYFLNWFDDQPRDKMRAELAAEIRHELQKRKA